MVSVLLRSLVSVIKDGHCEMVPLMRILPVSDTAQLWKVPETEWGNWGLEDMRKVSTYMEWAQQWNAGNINNVDDYEKLLLVTCRHATGTENFKIE